MGKAESVDKSQKAEARFTSLRSNIFLKDKDGAKSKKQISNHQTFRAVGKG